MNSQDITFPSPQENILYDEVLLYLAEKSEGGEVLRFWEAREHFIVLGRIGKIEEDIKIDEAVRDNIPILRRFSGGGTVIQGKGCLNYSFILSKELRPEIIDLSKSYRAILGKVVAALEKLNVKAVFQPISDVALAGSEKKISGNAQHRGKKFILHHGTILYDFNLSIIERYLTFPKSVPEYRRQRSHEEFVANVNCHSAEIKRELKAVFQVEGDDRPLNSLQMECLTAFLRTKQPTVNSKDFLTLEK